MSKIITSKKNRSIHIQIQATKQVKQEQNFYSYQVTGSGCELSTLKITNKTMSLWFDKMARTSTAIVPEEYNRTRIGNTNGVFKENKRLPIKQETDLSFNEQLKRNAKEYFRKNPCGPTGRVQGVVFIGNHCPYKCDHYYHKW